MLDGKLWTATTVPKRTSYQSFGYLTSLILPVIVTTGRSHLPTGPVTTSAILPPQSGMVYVGHKEGFIFMWELNTKDDVAYTCCVEVMRVSVSDAMILLVLILLTAQTKDFGCQEVRSSSLRAHPPLPPDDSF